MSPYETTRYFTDHPASTLSSADWYALELWLAGGERVNVHHTLWCDLLEHAEIRSVSRAGIIIHWQGMLVRLSTPSDRPAWLEALPIDPMVEEEPGHLHSVVPVTLPDGWDVLQCVECGAEW